MGRTAAAVAVLVLLLVLELFIVTWCTLWPIALVGDLHKLRRFSGWASLYDPVTSLLDIWVLSLIRIGVQLIAWARTTPSGGRRVRRSSSLSTGLAAVALGPPHPANHSTTAASVAAACAVSDVLLLSKAVLVAIGAPDQPLPAHGSPGLIFMYTAICTPLLCSLAGGALTRWLITRRGRGKTGGGLRRGLGHRKAMDGDEEAGTTTPLLSSSAALPGGGSWEDAVNNKQLEEGGDDGDDGVFNTAQLDGEDRGIQPATVFELVRLSAPDTPLLLAAFVCGSAAALAAACVPYYTGMIIDYASIDPDRRRFTATTMRLIGVAALCGFFTGARGGLFSVAMWRLNVRLRQTLFEALLRQEQGFYDTVQTGDISSRLSADTTSVSDSISLNLNVLVRSATQAAMVLAFMFAACWRLTVITLVLVPVVLFISKVYGAYYRRLSKRVQTALAEANAVAEEVLSTQPTVRAHAAQGSARAGYAARLAVFYGLQCSQAGAYSAYAATTTFLPSLVVATVLYYGGCLVLGGRMSAGALVSFMLYQQSLSGAFSMMGDVFSALTAAVGAADKVVELIKREPREPPPGDYVPPSGTLEGALELRSVVFAYPARPRLRVLDGLSLAVSPGEVVALVGPSGGGKSTIIRLLQRSYLPQRGAVLVDGVELGLYDPRWLRRHIALVSQEPVLFARSVAANIAYGLTAEDGCTDPPTQEQIEEAARQANAHDFVSAFPDGYNTSCGEKGVVLSGGQKQRIAIARALVRAPQVLLLDEATSALDTESEAVVQKALNRLMAGRTVVVVAHRLSTVRNAGRIVVVARGAIAESGPHDELLAACGLYAGLVEGQLAGSPSSASMSRGVSAGSLSGLSASVGGASVG